ncbi:MAG: PINc/VapC family ATPase [Candidatus Thermoplasmatota archaeon]|jgi:ATPase|nr:PINc/VapC family ATPase [Candidatus Thermoplasmatota archaeon]
MVIELQETYIPDTSVIVDGRFCEFLKERTPADVVVPESLISEIEHQANEGRSIGFTGLEELKRLRKMSDEGKISLSFTGRRPAEWQIKRARSGEIDELIRQSALETNSVLVTGDFIQKSVAEIKGIRVLYLEPIQILSKRIETFFAEDTMSVHLKEGTRARMKVGRPGNWNLEYGSVVLDREELNTIANDIVERARNDSKSLIDMDVRGATVVQLMNIRIIITRPPVSDGVEITAVRPIKRLDLKDYQIGDSLMKRFKERVEGIIISGKPGAGKSTFVQALAEYYNSLGKVVKTIEKPRDLQVSQEITQLTPLDGSIEKTGDILLLERPDYTVFDEIRIASDFTTYSDLRLAGVGMLGVIHASRAIDAMQRFVGKIELGLIPQIIDTIIYIENGGIKEVLDLTYSVKIPSGMSEEDLARPIIEIKDFFTGMVLYEIYTFGEQVVVVPVKKRQKRDMKSVVNHIENELYDVPHKIDVDDSGRLKLYVPEQYMGEVIGKGGGRVKGLEQDIGMPIDIEEMNFKAAENIGAEVTANKINLQVGVELKDKEVEVLIEDSPLFIARVSKNGIIQVKTKSVQGRALRKAISLGQKIRYSII